jgi:xanthine/uracil permease
MVVNIFILLIKRGYPMVAYSLSILASVVVCAGLLCALGYWTYKNIGERRLF